VAIDPGFARAWAGLASAYWIETVEGRLPAPQGLANYWWRAGRRDLVAIHKSAALDAEPDHPLALSFGASVAADEGRYDRAIELQRRAVAAEPLSVPSRHNLATWLYLAGRPAEAREEWSAIREIDPSATDPGGMISLALVLERRFDSVLALAQDGTRNAEKLQALAMAYAALGRTAEADRTLAELLEASGDADPVRIAEVYAFRGQPDLAFEWLRAAADRDELHRCGESTCWPLEMAERLPFLAPLHSDPRWLDWRDSVRRRQSARDFARRG
jgi:tetratricopeptide (TPR) repeat protein